jgi:hypothetical protein
MILSTFTKLDIGDIDSIIEIVFKDTPKYKRIIVKLKWNNSSRANYILSRFREDKNVKLVYDSQSPWYWICVPNKHHCRISSSNPV